MERDPRFTRKSLDDPSRLYKTIGEIPLTIPDEAEYARQWFDPKLKEVHRPNGTKGIQWYGRIAPSAMIGHVDNKGTLALVTVSERYPSGRASIELPGGAIDPEFLDIIDKVSPEERERIFKETAIREAREEIGEHFEEKDVYPIFPGGGLQGSISVLDHECHPYVIFGEGLPVELHHDDGERGGMLLPDRYSISDAEAMVGYEIAEPFTALSVLKISDMHGKPIRRLVTRMRRLFQQ